MEEIEINNEDYLYKIVGFLNANWAFIQPENTVTGECTVKFVDNACTLFDELKFKSKEEAHSALKRNGFMNDKEYIGKYMSNDPLPKPLPPYHDMMHIEDKLIYSSGRYWK